MNHSIFSSHIKEKLFISNFLIIKIKYLDNRISNYNEKIKFYSYENSYENKVFII